MYHAWYIDWFGLCAGLAWYYFGMAFMRLLGLFFGVALVSGGLFWLGQTYLTTVEYRQPGLVKDAMEMDGDAQGGVAQVQEAKLPAPAAWPLPLDTAVYDERLLALVDYEMPRERISTTSVRKIDTRIFSETGNVTVEGAAWPPANPYPHGGALLPFNRIVAYYGNYYSIHMGILGEYERAEVLRHLASTTEAYEAADPNTPVIPAIHHISMVAQADAGADGMYRAVMPDEHIERAFSMAEEIDGVVFLDLQVGLSTLQAELPQFYDYFARPEAHLGIDPEFAMAPSGYAPGLLIGTYDAADINFAINWLSDIVREHQLPPKVLVVHRFTQDMVTNYQAIQPTPEVQVVMHMDGWGPKALKRGTHAQIIEPEPVQFAGVKVFYKNDLKPPSTGIFTPEEIVALHPEPVYIQYQ